MNSRITGAAACSLGALTACAPAPTALPSSPPSLMPAAAPATLPSAVPTPLPSSPTPTAPWSRGPWIDASAPAPGGRFIIVSGNVYDENGAPVDQVLVSIRSLDPSVPYSASAMSDAGSWVVNNVPDGVNMELIATKEGWTSRRRIGSFQMQATGRRNVVNFGIGNDADDADPEGASYFISDRPEVVETTPMDGAKDLDPRTLTYVLRLSEPLDPTNQNRLAEALRLFPANRAAVPGPTDAAGRALSDASYRDLSGISDADPGGAGAQEDFQPDPADGGAWAYALNEGDVPMAGAKVRAEVRWDVDWKTATLTFRAPLIAADDDDARYQVGLVAESTWNSRIRDRDGNPLGTDRKNAATGYPDPGFLLHNVFRRPEIVLPDGLRTGDARWAATHRMTAAFAVARDEKPPTLLAVTYETLGRDSRFVLRFDEPMAAFDGTSDGYRDPVLAFVDLDATGTAGDDESDDGEAEPPERTYDATAGTTYGGSEGDLGRAFRFLRRDLTARPRTELVRGVDDGRITLEVDPDEPTTMYLWVFDRPWIFADGVAGLKVQVKDVEDPAGNRIRPGDGIATTRI